MKRLLYRLSSSRSFTRIVSILAFAALGFWCATDALAIHSSNTSTSGGTSTCKLCTIIDFEIEVGDLKLEFVGAPNWNGDVVYTSRPGQTITGTVTDGETTEIAEFSIVNPGLQCTDYVVDKCSRSGRRDSELTFIQQCGNGADCTGQVKAETGTFAGQVINVGGASALTTSPQCATVFPQVKGKGGSPAGQMGTIVQLHINTRTCNALPADIVDKRHDQKACSSPLGASPGVAASCERVGQLMEAGFILNQAIIGAAAASCNPGSMQQVCDPNKDSGKHHISVTGAALAQQGVSANDVIGASLLCGNQIPPISTVIGDTDGDGLNDITARCFTCNLATGEFLCSGLGSQGQCELTGTDGVQPFAALCNVTLTP